ncbi:NusG domain II-containing protein [Vagococcus vulneris]|uniref:Uncharacterized protein n=1 Tax=Vagococcus vulneris TaxID=1977869 RepID=A0A429ZV22_9ENTE|nr:NusG domain II-containing protein [Vagococcus vulneris]RST97600.1 hypothetical protein CBF37_09510 [Vagococcus vulneris]
MNIWKELKSQWRFMDGIVIVSLIILSFIPYVVFAATHQEPETKGNVAIVSIDGKEVERFELNDDTPHKEVIYYPAKGKYNIVELEGNRIRVREDNSPDQIAVRTSWISRPGQMSICLPHKLTLEIKSQEPSKDDDDMIISY